MSNLPEQSVALSEDRIFYDVNLRVGEPSQKAITVRRGSRHARSPFEVEYAAAVERRTKSLLIGADVGGHKLILPGPGMCADWREKKRADIRLRISRAEHANGELVQNIHHLTIDIPLTPAGLYDKRIWGKGKGFYPGMVITFRILDSKKVGPLLKLELSWDNCISVRQASFVSPPGCRSLMEQALGTGKGVSWEGAMREHMVWQAHFACYARNGGA